MAANGTCTSVHDMEDVAAFLGSQSIVWLFGTVFALSLISLWWLSRNEPPSLKDTIPFVTNTYQYLTDNNSFLERAAIALKSTSVVKFWLGPNRVYLISGSKNVQTLFRSTNQVSNEKFILMVSEGVWGMTKSDVSQFANDRSGTGKKPAPGTEAMPPDQRIWAPIHDFLDQHLARPEATHSLGISYYEFFNAKLEEQPLNETVEVRLFAFLRETMAECATMALGGMLLFEVNPDMVDALWAVDEVAFQLLYGLPAWLNPKPLQVRARMQAMMIAYLEEAFKRFDWNSPAADADWEPIFGSRLMRNMVKFFKDRGFSLQGRGGLCFTNIFGINSNSVPIATWALMEVVKDPWLLQAVKNEVEEALVKDSVTGTRKFDIKKLLSLPLLQSIYVEALRLHLSINITREVVQPMTVDGYTIPKHAIIQAPTSIAHYDENVWSRDGHPASKFWAERHIKYQTTLDEAGNTAQVKEFSVSARPSEYFPYGGGASICPGRHFAKQEIMLTIAMIVSRFEIEFDGWTMLDGSKSGRAAKDNERYSGAAAVPPDRDMKVRWKRIW